LFLQHSTGPTNKAFSSSLGLWWVSSDRQKFLQANTGLTDIVAGNLASCKWNAKLFCCLRVFSGRRKQRATDTARGLCFLVSQNQRIVWFAVGCLRSPSAVVMHVLPNNGIGVILVVAVPPSSSKGSSFLTHFSILKSTE